MTLRLKAGRADTASVVACVLVWAVLWFQLFELKQVRRGRISEMADKFPEVCVLCVCVCVCVCRALRYVRGRGNEVVRDDGWELALTEFVMLLRCRCFC